MFHNYVCHGCGYTTNIKCNIKAHLQKKTICSDILEEADRKRLVDELEKVGKSRAYTCDCGNMYASRQGYRKHRKRCPVLFVQLTDNFGHETLNSFQEGFLTNCILNLENGVKRLIRHIYFDPVHPQCHTVRYKSQKQKLLEVYIDGKWIECDKNNTINLIIRKAFAILFDHFLKNGMIESQIAERYEFITEWFMHGMSMKGMVHYALVRDVFLIIKTGGASP